MIARTADSARREGVLFVTGTGTGVGKTIVTAAVAALAAAAGRRVAVVKLAQTGVHDGPGSDTPDLETVTRLSGVTDTHELARFPDPLSPEAAARVSGLPPADFARARALITSLAATRDLVLVEGAGGLLVRYDSAGTTIADLATDLEAPALIVTAAGLGTLNHTALTLEALAARKAHTAGVVIGSWPRDPGLAERENLADLETLANGPLAGLLPAGIGSLPARDFRAVAREGLVPALGGILYAVSSLGILPKSPTRRTIVGNPVTGVTAVHGMKPRGFPMTEPPVRRRNPVAANPITSAAIAILLIANIFFVLYSPLYSRVTPKIGSWPFFYFYLLIYMPITSVVLALVLVLQKRLARPVNSEASR